MIILLRRCALVTACQKRIMHHNDTHTSLYCSLIVFLTNQIDFNYSNKHPLDKGRNKLCVAWWQCCAVEKCFIVNLMAAFSRAPRSLLTSSRLFQTNSKPSPGLARILQTFSKSLEALIRVCFHVLAPCWVFLSGNSSDWVWVNKLWWGQENKLNTQMLITSLTPLLPNRNLKTRSIL